jgi:hypothetical protein
MDAINKKIEETNKKLQNLLAIKEQLEIQLLDISKQIEQGVGAMRVLNQLLEESSAASDI